MKTAIRKIGNSRGILIPARLIAACNIQDELTMHVEDNRLIIQAANTAPRKNWFANYDAAQDPSVLEEMIATSIEEEDWEW